MEKGEVVAMGVWLVVVLFFFLNETATTEFYTEWIVGSVRCV